MQRILALPGVVVASLALVACAPGSLDDRPTAASGAPEPSASLSPSASASASPEPTTEDRRFDDVDLAAALVPMSQPTGDGWGAWQTAPRDALVSAVDASAFSAVPGCRDAVAATEALAPVEVVVGGFPYQGVLGTSILVARMGSADEATAVVGAFAEAAVACDDVDGVAAQPGGLVAVRTAYEPSPAIADAGATEVGVAYDGSFHMTTLVMRPNDELVLLVPIDSPSYQGVDLETVASLDAQDAAFDALAAG